MNDCWLWARYVRPDGYGEWGHKLAHRRLYEILVGKVPKDKQLDHLCRVRSCVNPEHLEVVTPKENSRRGAVGLLTGILQKAKTHCPHGHAYSEENTIIYRSKRACRACAKIRSRAFKRKEK